MVSPPILLALALLPACACTLPPSSALLLGPDRASRELQAQIDEAIASRSPSSTIAGGDYVFGTANFNITGAERLQLLSPAPVTLWFIGVAGVNITNAQDVSLGNWTIDYKYKDRHEQQDDDQSRIGKPSGITGSGITLNLLNSTRVSVSDVTINHGKFMLLTAFNGGGAHRFTRMRFAPSLMKYTRDAIHFSDQRVGPVIEDSTIGFSGDDLFNIHTTLMVVLKCGGEGAR